MLRLLAEEVRCRGCATSPTVVAPITAPGARAALEGREGAELRRRLAQLTAVCDVYTWKLLRRDASPSRCQAELALVELLEPMLEAER